MKKLSILALLAVLGLSVTACSDRNDDIQREDVVEEAGHEMDEAGDNIEDAAEEVDD